MSFLVQAIQATHNVEAIDGSSRENIVAYLDAEATIVADLDWDLIDAKATELETAFNNKQYQRDRKYNYPSIQEQLDMQYWDSVNGTTTWADAIAAVKEANPKPE
jgi:phage baseplate assembly protein gpV